MNDDSAGREGSEARGASRADGPALVVGVGASAGGLDALQRFFGRVAPGSGAAFVVVQHLEPHHTTMLPELLARHSELSFRQVSGASPLEADAVHVTPPNSTLTMATGKLRATQEEEGRERRTPIDRLFVSLAAEYGERAVCVVLSGTGSDGTLGLKAVKEAGGLTIAQSAATAKYDGMPRSAVSTGLVDHVLAPEDMPGVIAGYRRNLAKLGQDGGLAQLRREIGDHLAWLTGILRRHTGSDFSGYKRSTLARRVQRRIQVVGARSVVDYGRRLESDEEEIGYLFRDLLIGVTEFFRDAAAFDALAREVIPRLVRERHAQDEVRLWVPGCATGEEAYSLAMLVLEALDGRGGPRPRVQIFATDLDPEALDVARRGHYPESIADRVSPARLERFFLARSDGFEVTRALRDLVVFSPHNLINHPPFSRLDLVSCRNLLIYLQSELQRELLGLFHYALRRGGFLFLGPSESVTGAADLFTTLDKRHRIFRARATVAPRPVLLPALDKGPRTPPPPEPVRAEDQRPVLLDRIVSELVLDRYAPVSVLVGERNEILLTTGPTGRFLQLPVGKPSLDVLECAVRPLRVHLRTQLHQARRTGEEQTRLVTLALGETPLRLRIVITRLPQAENRDLHLIVLADLGPAAADARRAAADGVHGRLVEELEDELQSTREQLQTTVEELETSNEELKSSNEELLSMNEEFQSTNEELQTSKEELQATNEELRTLNVALQHKIEEVDSTNADLQNLFDSTDIATVFLDRERRIKRFTPAAAEVLRLIEGDAGRLIDDIALRVDYPQLRDDEERALRTLEPRYRRVKRDDGHCFQARVQPYRTLEGDVDGVVLTFVDVTALIEVQDRLGELAAAVESTQEAVFVRDLSGTIRTWNAGAEVLFGLEREEALGRSYRDFVPDEAREVLVGAEREVCAGRAVGPVETVVRDAHGRRLDVSLSQAPVQTGDGEVSAVVAVARDIGRRLARERERDELRVELEARVEELAAFDRRKNEFLAMLGHELRNPLAPIVHATQRLRADDAGEAPLGAERRSELIAMIDQQAAQMRVLLDDLLDISRITQGKVRLVREALDLREAVELACETVQPLLEERAQALTVSLPEEALWVRGDRVRLGQVVANLLTNAIRYSPPHTRIDLTLEARAREARLSVRDEGVGMDTELKARIWDLFAQGDRSIARSEGGLGVGLTTVKRLVELHGGAVEAHSDGRDRGACFLVRLPLGEPPAGEVAPAPGRASPPRALRRVLIVEDNEDAATALASLVELEGHVCAVVHDGAAALEALEAHRPDLVLLDIGLPELDGLEVARRMRATAGGDTLEIVALTGYGREALAHDPDAAGFDRHLLKPIEPVALKRLLARTRDAERG